MTNELTASEKATVLKKYIEDQKTREASEYAQSWDDSEDKYHRDEINKNIARSIVKLTGCSYEQGQAVVKAIVVGDINNVTITY